MSSLPVKDPETFLGEMEEMDLSDLRDKVFGVAIGNGKRNTTSFMCHTLRAPLGFYEMVEMVGNIYEDQQLHAKAFMLNSDIRKSNVYLDECTIDYIEARYMDIITDGMLDGTLSAQKEFTCKAGFFEEAAEEDDEI